jgi:ADP-heptose:LPS heptosyltransferase
MKIFQYRYRWIHALFEKILSLIVQLFPEGKATSLQHVPQRILVLKFGGMGEAVLARSLTERIRECNPQVLIDYLVEERTVETMAIGSPGSIFRYSPASDGFMKAIKTLLAVRKRRYDAILDFEQHSLLTAAFARFTSIPFRVGFIPAAPSHRGRMFTHCIQLREDESMWSAFVRLGRTIDPGLPQALMSVSLPVSKASDDWSRKWLTSRIGETKGPIVAMHLGVGPSAQYRRWPVERFIELASALNKSLPDLTILLTGTSDERLLMSHFRKQFTGRVVEATEIGGLEHTCALLQKCDLLISADTGIMHLAAAMAVPTVGLFGPNTPGCWAPIGLHATYVYSTNLACSPCINSYRRHIPEKCIAEREGACMWDITVNDVLRAANKVVRKPWMNDSRAFFVSL